MRAFWVATVITMAFATQAFAQTGTDSQPAGNVPRPAAFAPAAPAMGGSDSNPTGSPGGIGAAALRASSAAATAADTVYFTPQDENTSMTALFLYNTNAVPDTVDLQTFYTNGSLTLSTRVGLPAHGLVRVCADNVSTVSNSWAATQLVNFTTFSAYAKMTVPKGVKYSAYVAWDTTGVYDPLASLETLPIRFGANAPVPDTVYFTPQDENTSTTVLFLYNVNATAADVALQTFGLDGSTTITTSINVPAHGLVRVCGDAVSTVSASWTGATLVNFTTFSAYGRLSLPPGVMVDGYVAWNTSGTYDPLAALNTLPLRFDSQVNWTPSGPPAGPNTGTRELRTMPNPSTGSSRVSFTLTRAEDVDLAIYDAGGRLVERLAHGTFGAGEHSFEWDGHTEDRGNASAGVYFVHLRSASRNLDARIVKLR